MQEENAALRQRIETLGDKVAFIESDIVTLKGEHIASPRNSFSNDQYMGQNYIEIEGIPKKIDGKNLESTVSEILRQLNVHLFEFEDCHRLPLNKRKKDKGVIQTIIVRFINSRACKAVLKNGIDSTKLYINDNLNYYYRNLAAKCRRFKKQKLILDTWTTSGLVKI